MTSVNISAFDYIPEYLEYYPVEYYDAVGFFKRVFRGIDDSMTVDMIKATSLDILDRITPVIDEPSDRPGRESGEVATKIGISPTHKKPQFALSLAVWGGLFFETPYGFHRIQRPGKQIGPFGSKRRAFIVWDISASNTLSLGSRFSRISLFHGEYWGGGSERYDTSYMCMMMLLYNAKKSDVLLNTYVYPAHSIWHMGGQRSYKDSEVLNYPDWRYDDSKRQVSSRDIRSGRDTEAGYSPVMHFHDEDPELVIREFSGLEYIDVASGGPVESFSSPIIKLYNDLMSKSSRGKEGVIILTDVADRFDVSDSYLDYGWMTYYIAKRADIYLIHFSAAPREADKWLASFPGVYKDDFGKLGRTHEGLHNEVIQYIHDEYGLDKDKITIFEIDRYRQECLHKKIIERALEIVRESSNIDEDEVVRNNVVDEVALKKRFVERRTPFYKTSGRLNHTEMKFIVRHVWEFAVEDVMARYMKHYMAVQDKIVDDLKNDPIYNLQGQENWKIKEVFSDEIERRMDDVEEVFTWDVTDFYKGQDEEVFELRRRYKKMYMNFTSVDDTNVANIVESIERLEPGLEESVETFKSITAQALEEAEKKGWQDYFKARRA